MTVRRIEQRSGTDCLRCCLSMVTELPYEEVPDFTPHGESWAEACEDWLRPIGAGLIMFSGAPRYVPPWLPVIAQGPTSYSEHHHCVVVTADEVVDPHPSQSGLTTIEHVYAVVKQHEQ